MFTFGIEVSLRQIDGGQRRLEAEKQKHFELKAPPAGLSLFSQQTKSLLEPSV